MVLPGGSTSLAISMLGCPLTCTSTGPSKVAPISTLPAIRLGSVRREGTTNATIANTTNAPRASVSSTPTQGRVPAPTGTGSAAGSTGSTGSAGGSAGAGGSRSVIV